jgi:hypothetical protein
VSFSIPIGHLPSVCSIVRTMRTVSLERKRPISSVMKRMDSRCFEVDLVGLCTWLLIHVSMSDCNPHTHCCLENDARRFCPSVAISVMCALMAGVDIYIYCLVVFSVQWRGSTGGSTTSASASITTRLWRPYSWAC